MVLNCRQFRTFCIKQTELWTALKKSRHGSLTASTLVFRSNCVKTFFFHASPSLKAQEYEKKNPSSQAGMTQTYPYLFITFTYQVYLRYNSWNRFLVFLSSLFLFLLFILVFILLYSVFYFWSSGPQLFRFLNQYWGLWNSSIAIRKNTAKHT